MKVISRADAFLSGFKFFKSKNPCHNGHDSPRYTSSGNCVECQKNVNKTFTALRNKRSAGLFSYFLHPDDHASALAYCQALDLDRGRKPQALPPSAPFKRLTPAEEQA